MSTQEDVRYEHRTVRDWVRRAFSGEIAITDFQRSFVWQSDKTAKYIKAIIDGKPVGLYLILQTANPPQFLPRSFNRMKTSIDSVSELVLDGQQRLTSLLQALSGESERRYFIQVEDLSSGELTVEEVVYFDKTKTTYDVPVVAYRDNLIPMDILLDETDEQGLSPLAHWCAKVGDDEGMIKSRVLESKILKFVTEHFYDRHIWFCLLPASIDRYTAAEIFVETNTSSVRIKRFDIEVACARGGEHEEDIRSSIESAYSMPGNVIFRHYFKKDPEDWIPDIGDWMFKVACLRADYAPRDANYRHALEFLLQKKNSSGKFQEMESIFESLAWALERVSEHGAVTQQTVPSWPPLHVIAALHPTIKSINDPVHQGAARQLREAYYWRCLFSNRYHNQANERLYNDYKALNKALDQIKKTGTWDVEQPAFNDEDHPLFTDEHLMRQTGWIARSRLGKALASFVLSLCPHDWVTGEPLTPDTIRKLDQEGNLERHHVFSKHALKEGGEEEEKIQNGLNGVFLGGKTNRRLSKHPPEEYLRKLKKESKIEEDDLRARIEEHLVPYEEMKNEGTIKKRYDSFLRKRARMMAGQIDKLGKLPPGST